MPATGYRQVSTVAGSRTASVFLNLTGIAVDPQGNLYVAVWYYNQIEKVSPTGTVTLLAGSISMAPGTADGQGTAARFSEPDGLVIDGAGNLYVSDQQTNLIRKVTPGGLVSTIAGKNSGFINGTGAAASFNAPRGLAIDPAGNLYVADQANNAIRKITQAGVVTTVAGSGATGFNNGTGTSATFNTPTGVGIDNAGNLYIADAGNNAIRKITPAGGVTTFATGFSFPREVRVDDSGNLYVTDQQSYTIKKVTPTGVVSVVAGNGQSGTTDGYGNVATFDSPIGLALDGLGNLFIADNGLVRKVAINGYTINKALPAGLVFDTATGIISGTPTAVSPSTTYTVTAYNSGGSSSTNINIAVTGAPIVLNPPNISYTTPNIYTLNQPIAALAPVNTGGAVPPNIYGKVTTIAGTGIAGSTNGNAATASFYNPYNSAIDNSGNIYVSDTYNHLIRKITSAGVVTTLAGNGSIGSSNGTGASASFNYPGGIALDPSGNIFVSDQQNQLIREITPSGVVTTFAGNGIGALVNGAGASASFNGPEGLAFDATGNLYVADRINNAIRKITPAGVVTTFAGTGSQGSVNGPSTSATFNSASGVAFDGLGNLFVADRNNHLIRKITPAGTVTTFAGSGSVGSQNGTGIAASFNIPFGVAADVSGNVYVADEYNHLIRRITSAGIVTTLAGSGTPGAVNAIGTSASFNYPTSVTIDRAGYLNVVDAGNNMIRNIVLTGYTIDKPLPPGLSFDVTTGIITGTPTAIWPLTTYTVTAYNADGSSSTTVDIQVVLPPAPNISYQTPQKYFVNTTISPLAPTNKGGAVPATIYGLTTTFAGTGARGSANGPALSATFNSPTRLTKDASDNFYVADRDNSLIRKISSAGMVTTFASGFNLPNGVIISPDGNLYVANTTANLINKVTPSGVVTVYAGSGSQAFANGTGTAASFYYPYGISCDLWGNLYVADSFNHRIRKITSGAVVTTYAGNGSATWADGAAANASFNTPNIISADVNGTLYVSDPGNFRIRKISTSGQVSTYAGTGVAGSADGPAASATFGATGGVAADGIGNVYVADLGNSLIRKIDPTGVVSTLAGSGIVGSVNGVGKAASFNHPNDIQVYNTGSVYVTDYGNNLIRQIIVTGYTIDKPLPPGLSFDPTTGIITGTPTAVWPATDYTVTAYNIGGSSQTIVNIEVEPSLVFPAITAKTICSADFDPGATNNGGSAITYTSSNIAVATIVNNKIHIIGPGTSVITASDGFSSQQQTLTVAVPVYPTISITADHVSICAGTPVTFTAATTNGGSGPSYQWQINGSNAGTNSSTFIANALTSTDTVQCTVTNNDICPVSTTSNQITGIIVNPYLTPAVTIQSSATTSICPGTPVTFTAMPVNVGTSPSYQWQVNGLNVGSSSTVYSSSNFTNGDIVNCILTASGGCFAPVTATSNSDTVGVIAPANPGPSVTISASANNVYVGTYITFTAIPANTGSVASFQWKVNNVDQNTNSSTFTTNKLKNNDVITCTITLSNGCVATVTSLPFTVVLLPLPPVIIPNTFTPNGDSVNDTWSIAALAYYPDCQVNVYNRYGSLVYQSKGYSAAWDGTYKGKLLPVGTYYYLIDLGTKTDKLSGAVSIVR
ncbi:gliding motility-associated C-terminal domain-containing protein [Mucilaginibacter sp. PPCGB 2223]|uniref:T9SS type B sorting domain-containing protein n=1 Tax=Mucilaginibacter sp. PPCGB 2223 TaxID=1886027 RepID=UPI0015865A91|nr:gliding motility-associated C-terminal domain-containing protein [Mucilaginibacter sp. PPCGB 2223]